jgi:hypothetical protein
VDDHPNDGRPVAWQISIDSRGITTFGACVSPNDDPHTIKHLIRPNWPRLPVGDDSAPQRPVPIGVGGHL